MTNRLRETCKALAIRDRLRATNRAQDPAIRGHPLRATRGPLRAIRGLLPVRRLDTKVRPLTIRDRVNLLRLTTNLRAAIMARVVQVLTEGCINEIESNSRFRRHGGAA